MESDKRPKSEQQIHLRLKKNSHHNELTVKINRVSKIFKICS